MKINVEKRNGDYYIITGEKYKDNNIVINASSIIKTDDVWIQDGLTRRIEIVWVLRYDESLNKLFLDLLADDENSSVFTREIDLINLTLELIDCVKNNSMLEKCELLNSTMNSLYQDFFNCVLNKNDIICSNNILTGKCIIKVDNKIIGTASRFVLQPNNFCLLEYVGKSLKFENNFKASIHVNNKKINIIATKNHEDNDFYDSENHLLAYYNFSCIYVDIVDQNQDETTFGDDYQKLNVPYILSTPKNMYSYIIDNNIIEDIVKYRISIKPEIRFVNINRFMVNEFSR